MPDPTQAQHTRTVNGVEYISLAYIEQCAAPLGFNPYFGHSGVWLPMTDEAGAETCLYVERRHALTVLHKYAYKYITLLCQLAL